MSSRASRADSWLRRARVAGARRLPSRRGVRIALRIALRIGLLAYVLGRIELGQVLELAAGIRLEFLALACALVLVDRILAAYRWYILLRGKHPSLGLWPVLRLSGMLPGAWLYARGGPSGGHARSPATGPPYRQAEPEDIS